MAESQRFLIATYLDAGVASCNSYMGDSMDVAEVKDPLLTREENSVSHAQ
jgi:hypothetical protein